MTLVNAVILAHTEAASNAALIVSRISTALR